MHSVSTRPRWSASGLRARRLAKDRTLVTSSDGHRLVCSDGFLSRASADNSNALDLLIDEGLIVRDGDPLGRAARLRALADRSPSAGPLDYLILVPTLRCNLDCSYCQVSRVNERRNGFDWSDETLAAVLALIDSMDVGRIKIEFQGGEPTLRPDLIRAVAERCERFPVREIVICTNLQCLNDEILAIIDRPDVFVSTSLDGEAAVHRHNRTGDNARTERFLANLAHVIARHGPGKVSALPTIDPTDPPDVDELIDAYARHGLDSIFLRPINYQGFARKRHGGSREQDAAWRDYYERFVRGVIERNWEDRSRVIEETYLSIALRRILRPGDDRHVDLRSPNPMGVDYVVIDHDGAVYPTDEARMLARSGVIDLAIGDVHTGWATETRDLLNAHSTNRDDPACSQCAHQPWCGRDLVDDLSRYGRIDMPRPETEFCRRHMHLFDLAFDLMLSDNPKVRHSLSRWLRLPGTPSSFVTVAA